MAKVLQLRRGTTAEHANFTGAAGEVTVDTTDKRLVVHDGSTKGGVPAAKKSEIEGIQQAVDQEKLDIRALIAEELAKYLPLAGGTMTGNLKFANNKEIQKASDDSFLAIYGGTGYRKGSRLVLGGIGNETFKGTFNLVADTGDHEVSLVGNANDNTLKWRGGSVLTSAGGEMSGAIVNTYGDLIRQKITSGWTSIKGGTNNSTGGYVTAYGKDFNNGSAILGACNGQAVTELVVNYNGTATINGHQILTINNPSVPNYLAGVDISTNYTAPTAGYVVIDSMGSYSGYTELYVNSVRVSVFKTTAQMDASCTAFVNKGDVVSFKNGGGSPRSRFYPIKVGG